MERQNQEEPEFDFDAVFEVDDYLYFYGDSLTEERNDTEVAALVKLLELETPMDILDLACGFGRHANRLAANGQRVTGIDMSPGFLEVASQDAAARGVRVDYRQGDMRSIDFEAEYDRVMLLFTAFGYYSDEANLLVVQNVARALKPGGLFIFDTPNRDTFIKRMLPYIVTEKGGNLMIDRISFDCIKGRLHNRRLTVREGVIKQRPFTVRLYNFNEIESLLGKAGLEVYRSYGGWGGEPLTSESNKMIIIARK